MSELGKRKYVIKMCEFDVFLNGEKVFEEAVYFKREDSSLVARNILGEEEELGDVEIDEIDVSSEKLVLVEK